MYWFFPLVLIQKEKPKSEAIKQEKSEATSETINELIKERKNNSLRCNEIRLLIKLSNVRLLK